MGRISIMKEPLYKEIFGFIVKEGQVKTKQINKKFEKITGSNLSMKLHALKSRGLIRNSSDVSRTYEPNWEGILKFWLDNYFKGYESELFEYFFMKNKESCKEWLYGFVKFYLKRILLRKQIAFTVKKRNEIKNIPKGMPKILNMFNYISEKILDIDTSFKVLKEVYFKINLSKKPSSSSHYMHSLSSHLPYLFQSKL